MFTFFGTLYFGVSVLSDSDIFFSYYFICFFFLFCRLHYNCHLFEFNSLHDWWGFWIINTRPFCDILALHWKFYFEVYSLQSNYAKRRLVIETTFLFYSDTKSTPVLVSLCAKRLDRIFLAKSKILVKVPDKKTISIDVNVKQDYCFITGICI